MTNEVARTSAGKKIRTARERLGISQRALARRVECSNQAISNYEAGTSYPSEAIRGRIEAALDISLDDVTPRQRRELDACAREHFRQGWARWEIVDLLRGDARGMGLELTQTQSERIVLMAVPVVQL